MPSHIHYIIINMLLFQIILIEFALSNLNLQKKNDFLFLQKGCEIILVNLAK